MKKVCSAQVMNPNSRTFATNGGLNIYKYLAKIILVHPIVGENIIATTKIQNYYGALQSQYWTFLFCSL